VTSESRTGRILEALPRALYRVQFEDGSTVIAHIGRAMRLTYVRALPGDLVEVELTAYDRSRGRIVRRVSAQI